MKFNSQSVTGSLAAKFLGLLFLSVSFVSCKWGEEIESLVQPDPDDFAVLFSDTARVHLSTVITDSMMTGGPSRMLVGRYIDPYFGKTQATSFFQPTIQTAVTIPEGAEYDSLVVSFVYDNYTYGDTTKPMNVSVHKLLADITEKGSYYNENTTPFEPVPVGSARITPRPRTRRQLRIKLSDALGGEIFAKAKLNQIPSNTEWITLVKGFVIKPGANDNGAVVGFSADSASVRLHYHVTGADGVSKDSSSFNTTATYNQLLHDRTGTALAALPTTHRIAMPTSQTGNLAFIQAGSGIMTRIDLPTVKDLKNTKYSVANRAFLTITPLKLSITDQLRGPAVLYAYRVDRNNEFYLNSSGFPLPLYSLSVREPQPVAAVLVNDLIRNTQYYRLDVSSLVTEIIASETGDAGGLVLRTSTFNQGELWQSTTFPAGRTEFSMSLDRLVFADQQNAEPGVKLELYYTTVKVR